MFLVAELEKNNKKSSGVKTDYLKHFGSQKELTENELLTSIELQGKGIWVLST